MIKKNTLDEALHALGRQKQQLNESNSANADMEWGLNCIEGMADEAWGFMNYDHLSREEAIAKAMKEYFDYDWDQLYAVSVAAFMLKLDGMEQSEMIRTFKDDVQREVGFSLDRALGEDPITESLTSPKKVSLTEGKFSKKFSWLKKAAIDILHENPKLSLDDVVWTTLDTLGEYPDEAIMELANEYGLLSIDNLLYELVNATSLHDDLLAEFKSKSWLWGRE